MQCQQRPAPRQHHMPLLLWYQRACCKKLSRSWLPVHPYLAYTVHALIARCLVRRRQCCSAKLACRCFVDCDAANAVQAAGTSTIWQQL